MATYLAIGHFKYSERLQSICYTYSTKKDFIDFLRDNDFVPCIVFTKKTFSSLYYEDSLDVIKRLISNYTTASKINSYVSWHFNELEEKFTSFD